MANQKSEEVRALKETVKEMQLAPNMGILAVNTDGQPRPLCEQEDVNWRELTNAFRTRKRQLFYFTEGTDGYPMIRPGTL